MLIFFHFIWQIFIPVLIENQWFAIVANFIDLRFDILNSDKITSDEIQSAISTIIYNFKSLFILAYPHCHFNIRDFPLRYVDVPKQTHW